MRIEEPETELGAQPQQQPQHVAAMHEYTVMWLRLASESSQPRGEVEAGTREDAVWPATDEDRRDWLDITPR